MVLKRISGTLARIPGVPSRRGLGRRLVSRDLANRLGDADFVGLVVDHDGWHVVPSNYETDGDEEWGVPVDGSEPYRADGVGGDWGTLFGIPVVVGYRNFGAARQLPNTQIARDVIVPSSRSVDEYHHEPANDDAEEPIEESRLDRLKGWFSRDDRSGPSDSSSESTAGSDRLLGRGLVWVRGDADALDLVQDSDGQWALERVDYSLEDQMYDSRDSENPYDAEGAGAAPKPLAGVPVGFSNGRFPWMIQPIRCRLARNMVEERLAGAYIPQFDDEGNIKIDPETGEHKFNKEIDSWGGGMLDENGRPVRADGGVPESAPEPNEVEPGWNDIELEERAFVNPDDVKQLGAPESTMEKIESMLERVKASQNTPGGDLREQAMRYGGYFLALILGWWFGQQGGGGGGGGGESESGSSVSPVMADFGADVVGMASRAPAVALEAGVGVV